MRSSHVQFLIPLLVSGPLIAAQPDWQLVEIGAKVQVFVDANNIKIRAGKLTAWVSYTFTEPQDVPLAYEKKYLSMIELRVFDCTSDRSGSVSTAYYSEADGNGDVVSSAELDIGVVQLSYNRPGTVGGAISEFVCTHAKASAKKPPADPKDWVPAPKPKTSSD